MNWLLPLANFAGNQLLRLDEETLLRMQQFRGKRFLFALTEPQANVWMRVLPDGIELQQRDDDIAQADVTLSGSLWAFVALAGDSQSAFRRGAISFSGDTALGQKLQHTLQDLDIDWDTVLSENLGQQSSQVINNAWGSAKGWWQENRELGQQNIADALVEELHLLPSRPEFDQFTDNIETLRSDLARTEARIQQLLNSKNSQ